MSSNSGTASPDPSSHRPMEEDYSTTDYSGLDSDFQPSNSADSEDIEDLDDEFHDSLEDREEDEEDDEEDEEDDAFEGFSDTSLDALETPATEHTPTAAAASPAQEPPTYMLTIQADENGTISGTATRADGTGSPIELSQEDLFGQLGRDQLFRILRRRRPRPRLQQPAKLEPVPNPNGTELMLSGKFGSIDHQHDKCGTTITSYEVKPDLNPSRRILSRELGAVSPRQVKANKLLAQGLIPNTTDTIIHHDFRVYSGQFSDDGNFFFSCSQDMKVQMYETSNPYNWKFYKQVAHLHGHWTITDATLSPDNQLLASSSLCNSVSLASTDPSVTTQSQILDFNPRTRRSVRQQMECRLYSLRFSGDGTEIVAGSGDGGVFVYDLGSEQTVLAFRGHSNDVNAVCYGDKSSPHILYSGSDDCTVKVWDRRSMGSDRAAGVFLGHVRGLTYVDSKGDGRYILSNGKDQTMKLWDLRKMWSPEEARYSGTEYDPGFDYRGDSFSMDDWQPHPKDCSVVTFRGHKVSSTLIRCHFSPSGSTDSRYVYSGSSDGSVYIWNLDATLAKKIDVLNATRDSRPPFEARRSYWWSSTNDGSWVTCVRDASWHPNAPMIAATAWNGPDAEAGSCTVHTWNDGCTDDEDMGGTTKLTDRLLEPQPEWEDYRRRGQTGRPRSTRVTRRRVQDEDDDW